MVGGLRVIWLTAHGSSHSSREVDPVPVFEVRYVHARPPERVHAERLEEHGRFWALMVSCLVVNQPRDVVALRLPMSEVASIEALPSEDGHSSTSSFHRGS